MHIVFVTTTYPPENGWGGIGSYVHHMARGLESAGQSVTVLCGYRDRSSESTDERIRVLRRLNPDSSTPIALQVLEELQILLRHESIDVIEFAEHDALGIEFQRAYPAFPTVVKLHGDSELCFFGRAPLWKQLAARLYQPAEFRHWIDLQRETVRRAHVVVAPSHWALGQWSRRGWALPDVTAIVPNPFSGWIRESSDAPAGRYSDNKVLWLGRLDRLKGIHLLPAIARSLWKTLPEVEFHLIGQASDGVDHDIRRWILRRVPGRRQGQMVFFGGVPYAAVLNMLNQYSMALFASAWETFSYTQLECMWAGIACVSASGSGAAELGRSGEHVLNCRRHPDEIGRALALILGDTAYRQRLGQAASTHVQSQYNTLRIARAMTCLYARATEAAGRGTPVSSLSF
jgi:glycosyltransferase involved in cell wall biosynthesis